VALALDTLNLAGSVERTCNRLQVNFKPAGEYRHDPASHLIREGSEPESSFFMWLSTFFFAPSQNYVPPRHVFHVEKVAKNVACYCKIVTLHPICCRVLSPPQPVHCHFVNTRNCKFPLIFHVVYHIHKSIYILCFESSFWFEMDWWSYLERGSLHMSVGVFSQCVVCFHLSMWLITFLCALSHSIGCYTFFLCIPSY
jgi:hypothetical protein